MNVFNWLLEKYGNANAWFDLTVALLVPLSFWVFGLPAVVVQQLTQHTDSSTVTLFGVIIGFLLTTFSLLFLYNPVHSKELIAVRKHPAYKRMLRAYISTAFVTLVLVVGLLLVSSWPNLTSALVLLGTLFSVSFALLRIVRCIYYLYVIIELS